MFPPPMIPRCMPVIVPSEAYDGFCGTATNAPFTTHLHCGGNRVWIRYAQRFTSWLLFRSIRFVMRTNAAFHRQTMQQRNRSRPTADACFVQTRRHSETLLYRECFLLCP